jgi:cytochrome c
MKFSLPITCVLAAVMAWSLAEGGLCAETATPAADANAAAAANDSRRADALLARAVARYQANRDSALAEFNETKGPFVDGELYVFVVSLDGIVLASGGSSAVLIGRNVTNQQDAMGKYFFRELIAKAKSSDSGTLEYRWLNVVDNQVERKIAHFQRVGDVAIAVGHYVPRAAPAEARALLKRAVDALQNDRAAALKLFNDRPGPYFKDDLYVFVIDLNDKRFLANGANPSLAGKDAMAVVDVTPSAFGRPLLERMMAAVADRDRAEVDYAWSNPVTNLGEHKHAYLRKVNQMLVGVGYYAPS